MPILYTIYTSIRILQKVGGFSFLGAWLHTKVKYAGWKMKQHRRPVGGGFGDGKLLGMECEGKWNHFWDPWKMGVGLLGYSKSSTALKRWSYKIHPFFHLKLSPLWNRHCFQVVKWESNVALKERDLLSRLAEKEQQLLGESKAEQQVAASLRLRELALRAGLVASQSLGWQWV